MVGDTIMNERLDKILSRGGRLEVLRDAERAIREAVEQPQPLDEQELVVVKEIVFVAQRLIWDSLRGGAR
jgi:hypothetical protein